MKDATELVSKMSPEQLLQSVRMIVEQMQMSPEQYCEMVRVPPAAPPSSGVPVVPTADGDTAPHYAELPSSDSGTHGSKARRDAM